MFINALSAPGWAFGDQTYTEKEHLPVLQNAEAVDKICTFHNVPLQSGHENVWFTLSVDRTQFWWADSKGVIGFRAGKWTAFDYADPHQLSNAGESSSLVRLKFVIWIAESLKEGAVWVETKRETWKLLLPLLNKIVALEKKRPLRPDIRSKFG
ncbi:hypothetical protein BGZ74_002912 [Mortierella antarctica]|nr:hypothetical protein BGZ74_002912 [Mortierella antarctica]